MAKLLRTRRLLRGPILLLALVAFPGDLLAAPAAPYGRDFVRDGASWPAEDSPALPGLPESGDDGTIERLREQLRTLEFESGPYAGSLSEPLADLARALDAAGLHGEAQQQRGRALHLLRVNEGLYSALQIPLLRDQLDADRRSGNFEALDARYDYYFRLFGNGLPPYTELRFAATLEYLRWQREALRRKLDASPVQRLDALLRLGDDIVERMQEPPDLADAAQLCAAVRSQLHNLYLLAQLVEARPERDPWTLANPRARNDFGDFDPLRERLELQRNGVRARGDAVLQECQARLGEDAAVARAQVLRERADWAQWWGSTRTAGELYGASWSALASAGLETLAQQWYAEPAPLPDNGVFQDAQARPVGVARVELEVDERGYARATLLEESVAMPRDLRRLPSLIRATRFRPALQNGEPVLWATRDWRFLAYD